VSRLDRNGRSHAKMAVMTLAAWERTDESRGLSLARWERHDYGWLFHGSEVLVGADVLSCTFSVVVHSNWTTRSVDVVAIAAAGETRRRIEVEGGRWSVDGAVRSDLDDCIDVDIAATPLTNTFPIRRLAGLAVGEAVTSPVAWVDVPALEVTRVRQTYERLEDRSGLACWRYEDPQHGPFVLTVDDEGIVVEYEGFARRVSAPGLGW
jgi:uncharacterized protein